MADTPKPPIDDVDGGWGPSTGIGVERTMEEQPPHERRRPAASAPVVRIGGPDREPFVLVAVVAAFIALALIKPWPTGGGPPPPVAVGTTAPTTRPAADPLAAIRLDCQDPPGWRVFSRERWARGVLRSWRALEPAHAASGPLDPAVPDLAIGPGIVALGYCATWNGPDQPPDDVAVRAWSMPPSGGGGAAPVALRSASTTLHPPLGALFVPPLPVEPGRDASEPPGSSPPAGLWPAGTFVFEVAGGTFERWWAITILDDSDRPQPSPIR